MDDVVLEHWRNSVLDMAMGFENGHNLPRQLKKCHVSLLRCGCDFVFELRRFQVETARRLPLCSFNLESPQGLAIESL